MTFDVDLFCGVLGYVGDRTGTDPTSHGFDVVVCADFKSFTRSGLHVQMVLSNGPTFSRIVPCCLQVRALMSTTGWSRMAD